MNDKINGLLYAQNGLLYAQNDRLSLADMIVICRIVCYLSNDLYRGGACAVKVFFVNMKWL